MNITLANSLYGYLQVLYEMNKRFISLCGIDMYVNDASDDKTFLDLISDIPRIIPYGYVRSAKRLQLVKRNGLLEFSSELTFLEKDFQTILDVHYDFLDKVRLMRNKYEHQMHGICFSSSCGTLGSNSISFQYSFEIGTTEFDISSSEIVSFLKHTNILYSKIVSDILGFINSTEWKDYPLAKRLKRIDFSDFNTIYNSGLTNLFGKILYDF